MTWWQAMLLGALQGVTEFLPISSSGHLVIFPWLFGWEIDPAVLFPFTVVLHWGTLLAVVAAFWNDLRRIFSAAWSGIRSRDPLGSGDARIGWYLLLATVPAALAGLMIGDAIERTFARPGLVGLLLWANAGLLLLGEWFRSRKSTGLALEKLRAPDAVVIGLYQVMALFPGISRSGSTIVGGLSRGFERLEAARFALLLAVPVMLGAGIVALTDLGGLTARTLQDLTIGFATSAVVGFVTIRWLLRFLSHGSLRGFAAYCVVVGGLALAAAVYRG